MPSTVACRSDDPAHRRGEFTHWLSGRPALRTGPHVRRVAVPPFFRRPTAPRGGMRPPRWIHDQRRPLVGLRISSRRACIQCSVCSRAVSGIATVTPIPRQIERELLLRTPPLPGRRALAFSPNLPAARAACWSQSSRCPEGQGRPEGLGRRGRTSCRLRRGRGRPRRRSRFLCLTHDGIRQDRHLRIATPNTPSDIRDRRVIDTPPLTSSELNCIRVLR